MNVEEAKKHLLNRLSTMDKVTQKAINIILDELENSTNKLMIKDTQDLPDEEWRDVENYEGYYKISNFGRVKSFCQSKERILRKFIGINDGYWYVRLFDTPHG